MSSINIPEAVSSIGSYAFQGCKALRTITVPDRVKDLYGYTFSGCTNLSKVIIGRDVGYVNGYAFGSCENLTDVYCYALKVPSTNTNAFYNVDLSYARLHVPEALVDAYETSYPWSEFGQIIGIAEGDMEQCAKPTISYASGKLTFDCATEDAGFFYDIWDDDIKSGAGGKVNLSVTYHIGVYAIKTGYKDSEVATGTLCWVDVQPTMEGVGEDAVAEVEAVPVLIQTEGSRITVQGAANGTEVFVYSTDGMQQGSVISAEGIATLNTSLQPGSVAIVRIGERTVKVLMK